MASCRCVRPSLCIYLVFDRHDWHVHQADITAVTIVATNDQLVTSFFSRYSAVNLTMIQSVAQEPFHFMT